MQNVKVRRFIDRSSSYCRYIQGVREREKEREGGKESCKERERRTKEGKGHTAGVPTAQGTREREYTRARAPCHCPWTLDSVVISGLTLR
uniref:Uncharacterized protein n=1 Tax=Trichogramma kaykai TaxID=54128 RepID=A0ABD2VW52_9HYME